MLQSIHMYSNFMQWNSVIKAWTLLAYWACGTYHKQVNTTLFLYLFSLFPSVVTFLYHTARWDKLHTRTAYLPLLAWIQWGSLSLKSPVVIKICKEQNLWATISQFHCLVILNKKCYAVIVSPTHGHSKKLNSYLTTGSRWSLSECLRLPRDPLKLSCRNVLKNFTQ